MAEIELVEDFDFEKFPDGDYFLGGSCVSFGEIAEDVGWALCNLPPGDYHLIIVRESQYCKMFQKGGDTR